MSRSAAGCCGLVGVWERMTGKLLQELGLQAMYQMADRQCYNDLCGVFIDLPIDCHGFDVFKAVCVDCEGL